MTSHSKEPAMLIHRHLLPAGATALGFALMAAPVAYASAPGPGGTDSTPDQATLSQIDGGQTAQAPAAPAPEHHEEAEHSDDHHEDEAGEQKSGSKHEAADKAAESREDTAVRLLPVSQILSHSPGIQAQRINAAEDYQPVEKVTEASANTPLTASHASAGGAGLAGLGAAALLAQRAQRNAYVPRHVRR